MNFVDIVFRNGSPKLALEQRYITVVDMLKYVMNSSSDNEFFVYKYICKNIPIENHICDGVHILELKPYLVPITIKHGLFEWLSERKDIGLYEKCNGELLRYLDNIDNLSSPKYFMVYENINNFEYNDFVIQYYRLDNPIISDITEIKNMKYLFECDRMDDIKINEKTVSLYYDRVKYLEGNYKHYFYNVCYDRYDVMYKKFLKTYEIYKLKNEEFIYLKGIFDKVIEINDDSFYYSYFNKILSYDINFIAYVIGIDISNESYDFKKVCDMLSYINKIGIDEYCKRLSMKNKKRYNIEDVINERNVLMEDYSEFNPFDIIRFEDGGKIYIFTRNEFTDNMVNYKNHWTNKIFPLNISNVIEMKNTYASKLKLPKCHSVRDFLNMIKEGDIYKFENKSDKLVEGLILFSTF